MATKKAKNPTDEVEETGAVEACPGCFDDAVQAAVNRIAGHSKNAHNAECGNHKKESCPQCKADPKHAEFPGHNV